MNSNNKGSGRTLAQAVLKFFSEANKPTMGMASEKKPDSIEEVSTKTSQQTQEK